jgi:hypothetical protein
MGFLCFRAKLGFLEISYIALYNVYCRLHDNSTVSHVSTWLAVSSSHEDEQIMHRFCHIVSAFHLFLLVFLTATKSNNESVQWLALALNLSASTHRIH